MPTLEKRKNSEGEIVAIRVRIRREGRLRLSRTFPLEGPGSAHLRKAERLARTWANEIEGSIQARSEKAALAPPFPPERAPARGVLATAWDAAHSTEPFSPSGPTALIPTGLVGPHRVLGDVFCSLVSEYGLTLGEIMTLRWQHVLADTGEIRLPIQDGQGFHKIQLAARILSQLLAYPGRRYGLIFPPEALQIAANGVADLAEKSSTRPV